MKNVIRQNLFVFGIGLLMLVVLGMGFPLMADGDSPEVIVGAQVVGSPVTPVTVYIDIFSIEPPPPWRPGALAIRSGKFLDDPSVESVTCRSRQSVFPTR